MDMKSFTSALNQIAQERGIPPAKVLETLEDAIAAAYKKDYGKKGQKIRAKLNSETGSVNFWQVKLAVDESMIYSEEELEKFKENKHIDDQEEAEVKDGEKKLVFNLERHIMIKEAKEIEPKIQIGEELQLPLEEKKDYGRIAAQTAKQVILQKIREVEKETILSEYKSKEGDIISGIVQRIEKSNVFVDIGKTLGILKREEQIPGEFYRPGQRMKFYILIVEVTPRGPAVFLSRSHPKLISKLFELEVPEVSAGTVVIKSIAREPGFRTKIAVVADQAGIDPIGSCVGQRGTRIMAVVNELGGEKIDVIEWKEIPEEFIANSLSPAKVLEVKIDKKGTAEVLVPEDQLSLAIGKDGRNVRLAANLTGWKIDIKPAQEEEKTSPPAEVEEDDKEKTGEEIKKEEVKEEIKERVKEETKKETKKGAKKKKSKKTAE